MPSSYPANAHHRQMPSQIRHLGSFRTSTGWFAVATPKYMPLPPRMTNSLDPVTFHANPTRGAMLSRSRMSLRNPKSSLVSPLLTMTVVGITSGGVTSRHDTS